MSDTQQGPGWWQASDGKWYSPEQAGASTISPAGPTPPKPIWKRWWVIGLGIFLLLVVIAALAGGGDSKDTNLATDASSSTTTTTAATISTEIESTTTTARPTTSAPTTAAPTTTKAPATPTAAAPATSSPTAAKQQPTPAPMTYNGTGKTATPSFPIAGGMTIFRTEHRGTSNFIVTLLTANGDRVDNLVNAIGNYNGAAGLGVAAGQYALQVEADGPWKITVEQPRPTSGDAIPRTYTGHGQSVAGPFQGVGAGVRFTIMHRGTSNFVVTLLDSEGGRVKNLVNEIGNFDGTELTRVDRGVFWIAIEADGDWKIDLANG